MSDIDWPTEFYSYKIIQDKILTQVTSIVKRWSRVDSL